MAQITEEDILNGVLCRQESYLRRIISKAPVPVDQEKYKELLSRDKKWQDEVFWKTCRPAE
jgi:hypothetical protein